MRKIFCYSLFMICICPLYRANSQETNLKQISEYERVGSAALQQLQGDWTSVWARCQISFGPGRPGYLGASDPKTDRIDIWIRPGQTPSQVAATIAHELGHMFDFLYMTPERRAQWYAMRNIPVNKPWYPCDMCSDYLLGAGDFAESVRWTFQGQSAKFMSKLGPPPTSEQQALIRRWFAAAQTAKE